MSLRQQKKALVKEQQKAFNKAVKTIKPIGLILDGDFEKPRFKIDFHIDGLDFEIEAIALKNNGQWPDGNPNYQVIFKRIGYGDKKTITMPIECYLNSYLSINKDIVIKNNTTLLDGIVVDGDGIMVFKGRRIPVRNKKGL